MFGISKNNIITFISIFLLGGICLYLLHYNSLADNSRTILPLENTHKQHDAYEYLQHYIDTQEVAAWDLLQRDTHITKEECIQKQHQDYTSYKQFLKKNWHDKRSHHPQLKKATISIVENVLHDFGINPADIQIVPFNDPGSPAAADDETIFINENECAHFSPEAHKFFIAHEISHLQAQDDSTYKSLYFLSKQKKGSRNKKQKALEAFRRFQEIRADVYALLHGGQTYAQGAFEFLYTLQKLDGGDNPGITHPKTSQRIKMVQKICSMMGWDVPTVQVKA